MDWKTPFAFPCGLELRNRLVFAPISTMSSTPIGKLTKEEMAFYQERAKRAGLVILGSASISTVGKAYDHNVSLSHDAMVPNLKEYNRKIHGQGAKSIVQLYHGGAATAYVSSHRDVLSVSDPAHQVMSDRDIQQVLLEFGRALRRAIKAGFDGVEIHAGNPFLIQQFLSPLSNKREDFWGGNEEKRFHFLAALVRLVLRIRSQEAAHPFAIGVRLAVEEKVEGGLQWEETLRIVKRLERLGIDYVHFNQNCMLQEPHLRGLETGMSVIGNGGIRSVEQLEQALDWVPLVSLARELILEPGFPEKRMSREEVLATVPEGLRRSIEASWDWYHDSE